MDWAVVGEPELQRQHSKWVVTLSTCTRVITDQDRKAGVALDHVFSDER